MAEDRLWSSVWITGASSGIGYELARLMTADARHVAVSARSAEPLVDLAAAHKPITAYPLDVTDANAVAECVSAIESRSGPIDLAVLNAGTWSFGRFETHDLETIRSAFEVNYMGVVNALNALLPNFIARGAGHVAIVASVAGYRGLPNAAAYGPTKAALINLAETLRCELAPLGIAVSLVNPGFVDTPMTRDNSFPMPGLMTAPDAAEEILKGLRKGRYEIAFPRRFIWGMKLLRLVPNSLYFRFVRSFVG